MRIRFDLRCSDPMVVATLNEILTRLTEIETNMADITGAVTALTDAVASMQTRIDADVQHLRDLLSQALATDTANQAEIARLNAEGDAAVASITGATAAVAAIDPLSDNPAPTPVPDPEPPVDVPPPEPDPTV